MNGAHGTRAHFTDDEHEDAYEAKRHEPKKLGGRPINGKREQGLVEHRIYFGPSVYLDRYAFEPKVR